jgi:nitroreductase
MDGLTMIKTRRSIRKYIKKKIPEDIITEIIDCGRLHHPQIINNHGCLLL